ncbi:hypothetical protein ACFUTY_34100 [Streptomyces sp. NPDC057362]|uniref:hypothetical protein n=1 Tax=Streptomyces sp. NPDC057362 TaxID=3346106 RepID=UPI003630E0D3
MSDFSPGARLCKILFGRATGCAYPDCSEPLIEEHRGHQSPNVEVAHIRAEKPGGARYDPEFTKANGKLNGEENLLLLCLKHHRWVDAHEESYPTEELLAWKARQVTESRGAGLSAKQLDQVVKAFTTPKAEAEAVGASSVGIVTKIENLKDAKPVNVDSVEFFPGVRISNVGAIDFTVDGVGFDLDLDGQPSAYLFPPAHRLHQPVRRLQPQSNGVWIADADDLRRLAKEMIKMARVPTRFRAFGDLGSGSRVHGPWVSSLHLPVWEGHVTQEWLDGFIDLAKQTRAQLGRDT